MVFGGHARLLVRVALAIFLAFVDSRDLVAVLAVLVVIVVPSVV